jgi:hypothetical protein
MSLRIYTYKITFEEVLYYYYGVHKEKYFNEEYFGTPITHKWMWDFYTPIKQILEIFEYNDTGWKRAQEVEKRLIRPFYNTDPYCLNENIGGFVSLKTISQTGKKLYETKSGMFSRSKEQRKNDCSKGGKLGGKKLYEQGKGLFKLTQEEKIENCRKGGIIMGKKSMELGIGIHNLTKEQRIENGKIYGKVGGKITAEKKARDFSLISPCGEIINAKNLTKFCRDNGLTRSNIQAVLRGDRAHHKGWRTL